jgi:hypothetical protein
VELSTVVQLRNAFLRLVGTVANDSALVENGEALNEVADTYLTLGCREAQRWMLHMGYAGWRKRSSALTWLGSDAADGGRYCALPSDFLRAYGNQRVSALREANGDPWGVELLPDDELAKGNGYSIRGDTLWLARTAQPPTPVYLEYHYTHPLLASGVTLDFPVDARSLIVAEAANVAKEENWEPLGPDGEQKIERYLARARERARDIARANKGPRTLRKPRRLGNRW